MPRLLPLLAAATLTACENDLPTAVDEGLLPVGPVTVEVRLPWSQFAANLRVLGGFGRAAEVGKGFLAQQYQGVLDARTLVRLASFPREATVRDSTGTTRADNQLTFLGGSLMVKFDLEASTNAGPVTIGAGRTLTRWDVNTVGWVNAVDTLTRKVPWPEAGGGPVAALSTEVWNKSATQDSVMIKLDSAMVAALADTASDRGVRITVETPGERLQVRQVRLYLTARPSVNKDTVITLPVEVTELTFIYAPPPSAPADGLRVGGIPSWRSIFTLALPASVAGSPAACARVTCPLTLTADRINHAGLVLTTRPVEVAFRPTDSLAVEARAVLAPEALPKSPLGNPLFVADIGRTIGASLPVAAFQPGGARTIELALTPFVQDLARGKTLAGGGVNPTLALISLRCPSELTGCFESQSLAYSSFVGPGQPAEPYLRLILTVSDRVKLP